VWVALVGQYVNTALKVELLGQPLIDATDWITESGVELAARWQRKARSWNSDEQLVRFCRLFVADFASVDVVWVVAVGLLVNTMSMVIHTYQVSANASEWTTKSSDGSFAR
jgi:hypothetical protein